MGSDMADMTAKDIVDLLAAKHRNDVFVPECKDGPTISGSHSRMDAWVMLKSWARPLTIAYEVKVSRSDFTGDNKWHGYLAYCNEFYFACPHGLIQHEELPPEVGLLWVAKNGGRLFVKKKAQRRDVQVPESVYRYILMHRMKVTDEVGKSEKGAPYWHNYVQQRGNLKRAGHYVGGVMGNKLVRAEERIERLRRAMKIYCYVRRRIKDLGFDVTKSVQYWEVRNKLDTLTGEMTEYDKRTIRDAAHAMNRMAELLSRETKNRDLVGTSHGRGR